MSAPVLCPSGCSNVDYTCRPLSDFNFASNVSTLNPSDYMFMVSGTIATGKQLIVELFDGKLQKATNSDQPVSQPCPTDATKSYFVPDPNARVFYRFKFTGYNSATANVTYSLYYVDASGAETEMKPPLTVPKDKVSNVNGQGTVSVIIHFPYGHQAEIYNPQTMEKLGSLSIPTTYTQFRRGSTENCNAGRAICAIRVATTNDPCICNFYGGSFNELKKARTQSTGWWSGTSIWHKILVVVLLILIVVALAFVGMIGFGIYHCLTGKKKS